MGCSARWMWIGICPGRVPAAATAAPIAACGTARTECSASPTRRFGSSAKTLVHGAGEPRPAVGVEREPALRAGERAPVHARLHVDDRQQGQRDARFQRRLVDRQRHRRRLVVCPAVGLMVQVVELDHRGVAALEQLDLELGRDRALLLGRDPLRERVHRVAPAPEARLVGAQPLGQPGQRALEGVAVQVDHAGDDDAVDPLGVGRRQRRRRPRRCCPRARPRSGRCRPSLAAAAPCRRDRSRIGPSASRSGSLRRNRMPSTGPMGPATMTGSPPPTLAEIRATAAQLDRPGRAHAGARLGQPRDRGPAAARHAASTSSSSCSSTPARSRRGAPLP